MSRSLSSLLTGEGACNPPPPAPLSSTPMNESRQSTARVWTLINSYISSHFPTASLTTEATRPLSRPPPTFHPEPTRPKKKTTPKQLKTDHQRFKTTKQGKDRVGSHPIGPITVTVTHHTCRGNSKVLPTFGARENSGGSGNAGSIVGIVLGILVLLVIVALFGYYLRRRKSTTRGK